MLLLRLFSLKTLKNDYSFFFMLDMTVYGSTELHKKGNEYFT